jgi:hypothetical protein
MTVKEELKLDSVTENYYSCNLCKTEDAIVINFYNISLVFERYLILKCGYPNEEIYMHYEYYIQGSMKKYRLYEILESEWIKQLNVMNKAHPRHTDELFKGERHFIILFEDEVFECVATSYKITSN